MTIKNGESRETGSTGYKTKKNKTKTIQRNWQHRVQDEEKQNKDTTQYELDTTMRKQTLTT